MALFRQSKKERSTSSRRLRTKGLKKAKPRFFEPKRLLLFGGFLIAAFLVILICFYKLSPAGPPVLKGQVARTRVVAEFPFSYESKSMTQERIEDQRKQISPVYVLNMKKFERFRSFVNSLVSDMDVMEKTLHDKGAEEGVISVREQQLLTRNYLRQNYQKIPYNLNYDDISGLVLRLKAEERKKAIDEGLMILQDILNEGVYDPTNSIIKTDGDNFTFITIERDSGPISQLNIQPIDEALRSLKINLSSLDIPRDLSGALFRILRNGLSTNLDYNADRSAKKEKEILAKVEPVIVYIALGQTIIEPGSRVSEIENEQLNEYRKRLKEDFSGSGFTFESIFWERMVLTFTLLLASGFILMSFGYSMRDNARTIFLAGVVLILNLTLIRMILEWADMDMIGRRGSAFAAVIPYLAPTALGPMIVGILAGVAPGIFVAILISILNALMQGNSVPIMLVTSLSSLVAIHACYEIKSRRRVVRAGALAGLVMAISAGFLGLREALDFAIVAKQMTAGLVVGAITGTAVVGFLPFVENLFKYTSDITLLELTDFNHPLLRQMQVTAPGSYHHSLMVANLSENAAAAIGANPLVCRVCSLFHDIGKMVKPEYFGENQRDGDNPHITQNPSMSALVIKSHVKEGVILARQSKLPQIIIDVIQQHHGSTLIEYFYFEALKKVRESTPPVFPKAPRIKIDEVNESTYRYEGPKPQFKESAIIFLADSIEAACRAMRKVTPQSVDERVNDIIESRLGDHQLSDCPLNFNEIDKIKKSFSFTILNIHHTRVEYPNKAEKGKVERAVKEEKNASQRGGQLKAG